MDRSNELVKENFIKIISDSILINLLRVPEGRADAIARY